MDWKDKLEKIRTKLAEKDKILVAFSGGVDSSLLAKISRDVLGENALCIILGLGDPAQERARVCRRIGKIFGLKI